MEHSLHLGAGHFVRGVALTSSHKILKKVHHEARNAHNASTYDSDAELTDTEDGDLDNLKVMDDEDEFGVADSIGKALALVNQVSISASEVFRPT